MSATMYTKVILRKIWTFSIFVIAKLNLRETVLNQKNAKHNSRENKLAYSTYNYNYFFTIHSMYGRSARVHGLQCSLEKIIINYVHSHVQTFEPFTKSSYLQFWSIIEKKHAFIGFKKIFDCNAYCYTCTQSHRYKLLSCP